MREFINEFGKENFTIIAIVVLVILIALVLIVILEKTHIRKVLKKRAKMIIKNNKIKEENPDLKKCESFVKIELDLNESESEIVASRKYYNDTITDYNKFARSFPSNVVAKFCGYKQKTYFDGKDMNDEVTNDFKL